MDATFLKKVRATVGVALFLGLVQAYILWRTQAPPPPREFPKNFSPVAP